MAHQPKLSAETIYKKEFNVEFKGYSVLEVDSFLDDIITDYQLYQAQLTQAMSLIDQLQRSNSALQNKILELQGRLDAAGDANGAQHVDVLKRLAKLEQEVYKK
jgi:DivIVA domain-containing protein